jgi:predicted ribosome-associated RNA-binding protein Tma20
MATCAVSGKFLKPDGAAGLTVTVEARVTSPVVSGTDIIIPQVVSAETNASGEFTLTVQQSCSVVFTVTYPAVGTESLRTLTYTGNIPATATASFTNVIVIE